MQMLSARVLYTRFEHGGLGIVNSVQMGVIVQRKAVPSRRGNPCLFVMLLLVVIRLREQLGTGEEDGKGSNGRGDDDDQDCDRQHLDMRQAMWNTNKSG